MIVAGWLTLCVILCLAFSDRLWVPVLVAIALRVLIPNLAVSTFLGSNAGLHPASWLLYVTFLFYLVSNSAELRRGLGANATATFVALFAVFGLLVQTILFRTTRADLALLNTIVIAALAFVMLRSMCRANPAVSAAVRRLLVFLVIVEAALALYQYASESPVVYTGQRVAAQLANGASLERAAGTFDSPLDLSFFLAVCTPLIWQIRLVPWLPTLAPVFLAGAGIAASQSRGGLVAYGVVIVIMALSGRRTLETRLAMLALVATASWLLVGAPLVQGSRARFQDDSGSAEARRKAFELFTAELPDHLWKGGGYGSSFDYRTQGLLSTSLENGYLMLVIDMGLVLTLVLVLSQLMMLVRCDRSLQHSTGVRISALAAMVLAATFSGLMTQAASALMLWVALGLVPPRPGPEVDVAGEAELAEPRARGAR